ncbi:Uncharacterised protein [Weeksella virosa]|nr:Uncharacterised protein [Weeksella virosa]
MKKPILINFSVLFVMLLVFVGYWYHELFGQRIVHKFEVTDFSKLKFDTLRPNKKDNYTTHYVKLKMKLVIL